MTQPAYLHTYSLHVGPNQFTCDVAGRGHGSVDLDGRGGRVGGSSPEKLDDMLSELLLSTHARNQGGLSVRQQVQSLTGWVYVAIARKRDGVRQVPLRVYRRGADAKREEVTDPTDPYLALWRKPNLLDTRSEFWAQHVTFYELTGNSFWLKVRDRRGLVGELWILPSQLVRPWHTETEILKGYELETGLGDTIKIPRGEMVHFRQVNPQDRFWGIGTLAAAADAMKSQNAIKAAQLATFNNDILTSLYFKTGESLSEPQWKRLMSLLRSRYGSFKKAGMPLLLEAGLEPGELHRSPHEMAFRESSAFTRDEILSIFGVPPLLGGIVENANNSNTASQERVFEKYTLSPLLNHTQERINCDLSTEFGGQYEIEFDNPVAEDRLLDAKVDKIDADGITINEIRHRRGLPPVAWGDKPRWMLEKELLAAQQQNNSASPPADANRSVQAERPPSGRKPGRRPSVARGLLVRAIEHDYQTLLRNAVQPIRRFFSRQARRIQGNLEELFEPCPAPAGQAAMDGSAEIRKLAEPLENRLDDWHAAAATLSQSLRPKLLDALQAGARMQAVGLGVETEFDPDAEAVQRWLDERGADYFNATVNQTTRALLSETLARVLQEEPSPEKLRQAVEEIMKGRIHFSSQTIAGTETVGAYNAAAEMVRRNLGVKTKEWISALDHQGRDTHLAADGQVVAADDQFTVGEARLRYPGDADAPVREIVNCRCIAMAPIE